MKILHVSRRAFGGLVTIIVVLSGVLIWAVLPGHLIAWVLVAFVLVMFVAGLRVIYRWSAPYWRD